MKLILALAFLVSGCAETRIYDQGRLLAVIQADATNITVRGETTYFHADTLNHSVPTAAAYTGGTALVGGIAAGVATGLLARP